MKVQAIDWLYEYGPPVLVAPPGGAPLNAVGEVEDGGGGGAPVVVSPPATIQKPEGGADLTFGYKALVPTVGTVSTPDTADQTIDGDVRVTAFFRDDSVEGSASRFVIGKLVSGGDMSYGFIATFSASFYAGIGYPTGASTPAPGFIPGTRTAFGLTPPGTDVYRGAIFTGVVPSASYAVTCQAQGITSTDGSTWTNLGSTTTAQRADSLTRDSAQPLVVTFQWQGRIYWCQLEAINRAQLVFPGVAGNYLSVPDAANLDITGDIEIVARVSCSNWETGVQQAFASKHLSYTFAVNVTTALTAIFFFSDAPGTSVFASSSGHSFVAGQTYWVKMTRAVATGLVSFYKANDQPNEPTTWTAIGTATPAGSAGKTLVSEAQPFHIGQRTANSMPLGGRIARVIVRNGIAGTTVLDVAENNAGTMAPGATTFPATTGQTVTVNQTLGNTIVQPQANHLMWRFDASDYPGTGLSYVDPRGRTWTMSAADAISDVGSAQFRFPGVAGNYLSVPNSASLGITDDIEIVLRIDPTTWRPVAQQAVCGKYVTTGNQRSWQVFMQATGQVTFRWTPAGDVVTYYDYGTELFAAAAGPLWLKFTRVRSTGMCAWYKAADSPNEPTLWTISNGPAAVQPGVGIFSGTAPFEIGSIAGGTSQNYTGRVMRVVVRNGVGGTAVADVSEANATVMASPTTFTATAGGTVTEVGSVIQRT